jgi:hypothetical protein
MSGGAIPKPPLLWRNTSTGAIAIWFINGTTLT